LTRRRLPLDYFQDQRGSTPRCPSLDLVLWSCHLFDREHRIAAPQLRDISS
jgi:hypothetical protein